MEIYKENRTLSDYYNVLNDLKSDVKRLKFFRIISYIIICVFYSAGIIVLFALVDGKNIILPLVALPIVLIVVFGTYSVIPRDNVFGAVMNTKYKNEIRSINSSIRKTQEIISCIEQGKEIDSILKQSVDILT